MLRTLGSILVLLLVCNIAISASAPKLPPSTKKLTASEIVALYDQTPFHFRNYAGKQVVTGKFVVNFAKKRASGTFTEGKRSGTWTGTVRMKSNQFCRKIEKNREGCVYLYVDGNDIYEVNSRGRVESVNRR